MMYLCYLPNEEKILHEFLAEIKYRKDKVIWHGERVFLLESNLQTAPAWPQQVVKNLQREKIISIGDAVKKLRSFGKDWDFLPSDHFRRSQLILDKLSTPRKILLNHDTAVKDLGVFFLLEKEEMLYSRDLVPFWQKGELAFLENKEAPSRAYLKLWEILWRKQLKLSPSTQCLDLGSSPGGWTWALAQFGAQIESIDRSPLEIDLKKYPNITFKIADAFSRLPENGSVDMLFSDLICYPEKLLEFLDLWIAQKAAKYYACSIKFQGEADPGLVKAFQERGEVFRLYHNKHELTFYRKES